MDILIGVSAEWFDAITWISAIFSGLLLFFWRPRRLDLAALGSVIVFTVANIGAGIYVLYHLGDARWGGGAENKLSAPSLSDTPVVGRFMEPLDALMSGVVGSINEFIAFRAALPVALDFFAAAGWAMLISLPLALLALIFSYIEAKRRNVEFNRYKLQVEELSGELDEIRRHLGYPN
ncbi:hypothetical protein [Arthrobacter sp. ISL-30]|uniref:hypothetical protein n=1 Tax=Arthrobacter sp. ISL-30 TaxID=2819109 RepID=UPI001BE955BE|nr:hypothetical protein [Arthrobacter sp. ISL-30]MBT2512848.1 hypothetical protein [Arthrobacter sp. ISL-30]